MKTGRRIARVSVAVAFVATLAATALFALASCGGSTHDEFVGTWLRVDDHDFVLTIDKRGTGYDLRFENRGNGQSQNAAGIVRADGLQAALELPPEEGAGALAPGVPDVVPIMLRLEGEVLVVTTGPIGAETELWRYERK